MESSVNHVKVRRQGIHGTEHGSDSLKDVRELPPLPLFPEMTVIELGFVRVQLIAVIMDNAGICHFKGMCYILENTFFLFFSAFLTLQLDYFFFAFYFPVFNVQRLKMFVKLIIATS